MIGKRGRHSAAYQGSRSARPRRVLPLALGAVVATLSVAAFAGNVSRDLSKDRYAEDILREAIANSAIKLPKV